MMNRRRFGRTDLTVSELCLGTLNFGWHTDEATAFAIMDGFQRAGGNFIQACGLGAGEIPGVASTGVSEAYVGRWLRARDVPRDEVVIASRHAITENELRGDIFKTASVLRRSCEESLRRLGVRFLDVLVIEWNENLPMEETLLAAGMLVRAGMVRHVVASGFPSWRVMEWIAHSSRRDLCRFEAIQNEFSLVSNAGVNAEALELARAQRLGFVARAPLAGGFLAGRYSAPFAPESGRARLLRGRFSTASAAAALAEARAIAHARKTTAGGVALAWVLAQPQVSSALIGINSLAQLEDLVAATTLDLSLSDIQRLDWRWKITGGNPPDDELAALTADQPPFVAENNNNVCEFNMEENLHA
jgi:aryl-alcohol dehydrogenase-like predicted oxidoreductase